MGKDLKGKEIGKGFNQRKTGDYQARYVDRFGKRHSVYGKTLQEVKIKYAEAISENEKRSNVVDVNITLNEWFDKWIDIYKTETVKAKSIQSYKTTYKNLISPELGSERMITITKMHIQGMMNRLKNKGYSSATLGLARTILVDMLNRAVEDEYLVRNPAKGVKLITEKKEKGNEDSDRKVLTTEVQALFFERAAGTLYYNLYVVAVNTGLRPGELFALKESDIDFEKKVISVTKTLTYTDLDDGKGYFFHFSSPKTDTSTRKVPINNLCITALKRQIVQKKVIAKRNPLDSKFAEFKDLLFTNMNNHPLYIFLYNKTIARIISDINLLRDDDDMIEVFTGHAFRHTFATRCIEAGVKPKILQSYLGHATLQMTMDLYVHSTDDHMQSEMELLENEISKIDVSEEYISKKYEAQKDHENNVIKVAFG